MRSGVTAGGKELDITDENESCFPLYGSVRCTGCVDEYGTL